MSQRFSFRRDPDRNDGETRPRRFRVRRFRPRRKEIRLVHLLPNVLTSFNVASGVSAIIYGVNGKYEIAAFLILLAAFFDMIDGKVARLIGVASPFGVQLDSLADVISFGVAPPVLLHAIFYQEYDRIGLSLVLIYTLCTALRLARYNVQAANLQKRDHFVGLPCPVPACFIAALVLLILDFARPDEANHLLFQLMNFQIPVAHLFFRTGLHVVVVGISCLMVSTIPYPDLSSRHLEKNNIYQHTVFMVLILCVTVLIAKWVVLLITGAFILSGPFLALREVYRPQGVAQPVPEKRSDVPSTPLGD